MTRLRLPPARWLLLAACACLPIPAGAAEPGPTPSTAAMAALLRRLDQEADPQRNVYLSERRAAALKTVVPQVTDPTARLQLQYFYATALLNSGQNRESVEELLRLQFMVEQSANAAIKAEYLTRVRRLVGTAYLRIAEWENCQLNHTVESCLVPIREAGVHRAKFGAASAMSHFAGILEDVPEDLSSMWLLNLAAMTLGEYPEGVPARWRVPEEVFRSPFDIGRFQDVAGQLGLDVDDNSGGGLLEDFDGDGDLDLLVSSWALEDPMRFFINLGDGRFEDRTAAAGLEGLTGGLNMVHADYNNDGRPDVLILRGAWLGEDGRHPNSLLRNLGNGRFSDVTQEAGVLSFHPTQTACWLDYDADGWLDLFIGNETTQAPHPCELYHNNRDGTFLNVAAASGLDVRAFVKGVTSADYDNDGRPDLYLSVLGGTNLLFRNDGPHGDADQARAGIWRWREVAAQAGVQEPRRSFPTWFWDYNNDGFEDLFVSGYALDSVGDVLADLLGKPHRAEKARLFRNRGDGTFEDATQAAGLSRVLVAMGANFGDLDNDGWLDFYLGTGDPNLDTLLPNRMFRNDAGQSFQDVTTSGGFGHLQKGHAISFGDLDEDGDQDVHAVMGGAFPADHFRNALFRNPGHGHRWLKLKLQGRRSNRDGLGARIRVELQTPEGPRTLHRTVSSGGSFGGNPLRREIGLGKATHIDAVEIHWPASGIRQRFTGLQPDREYRIIEGQDEVEAITLKPFPLGSGTPPHDHHHEHPH